MLVLESYARRMRPLLGFALLVAATPQGVLCKSQWRVQLPRS